MKNHHEQSQVIHANHRHVIKSNVQQSTLERLLRDSIFVDFFNKFMCLPIFPIKCMYKPETLKFELHPHLVTNCESRPLNDEILKWILEERLPFFFQSPIYVEYQLCKLLTSALLFERKYEDLVNIQKKAFSNMTNLYQFKSWLKKYSFMGILCYTYWLDAQAAVVVHYRGEDHEEAQSMFLELKDKYYEKHSQFCLPEPLLVHSHAGDTSLHPKTSPEYTITVQAKALRHLQYYYMTQYLLACKNLLVDIETDLTKETQRIFYETLKMFVNRSFQNCNLVYSIHSETQLLSAPRNSAQVAESKSSEFDVDEKDRPRTSHMNMRSNHRISLSKRPSTATCDGHPQESEENLAVRASVTINPAEIMVMYNMQYKGQLQRTETIAEDEEEDELSELDSVTSEISEDGRRHTVLKKRESKKVTMQKPRIPSIYQSRSLFAGVGNVNRMSQDTRSTMNMNAKNSQLETSKNMHNSRQYLLGTEIKTRKMSKIPAHDLPYNLRKQSTVNRKMTLSRKMTMRRGTMSQHMRESKFDPENHGAIGGARPTTLLEPIIQESHHSLSSSDGGFQEKEEIKVVPVGANFVKTIKTRSNVAKAIKRFTRNSNFGKRSSKKAGTETVCVKFKLNETGEALQSFAVSKTGVAGGGHTARGSKVSILERDDKHDRLRSKMSLINSSQSRATMSRTTVMQKLR